MLWIILSFLFMVILFVCVFVFYVRRAGAWEEWLIKKYNRSISYSRKGRKQRK